MSHLVIPFDLRLEGKQKFQSWHGDCTKHGPMYKYNHITFGGLGLTRDTYSQLDSLIDSAFNTALYGVDRPIKINEDDNGYVLNLELPGYKQSHLDITVEEEVMTVKVKKDETSFSRSIVLPRGVDVEKIDAKLEDGILTINLPKLLIAKPRKVTIK